MTTAYFQYVNERGEHVEFGSKDSPFMLSEMGGIFGLPVEIQTFSQYQQDGRSIAGKKLQDRTVNMNVRILRNVISNRMHMLRVFSPKLGGTLKLIRGEFVRLLPCVVEQAPEFDTRQANICHVILRASNPFWMAEQESKTDIVTWEPLFEWPLDIPPEGIEFGRRTLSGIINIYNEGDVQTGMRVVFTAAGSVLNPALVNAITFERMKVNVAMEAGDRLTITTGFGEKRVEFKRVADVQPQNAFRFMDPSSRFLQLEPGDNQYRQEADAGEGSLLSSVFFSSRFLAV